MYKVIIGKHTSRNISWANVYGLIEDEFKTIKQKKRFRAFKTVSTMTRQFVNDGACWSPLGHINITVEA